jgi:prevent-host-death family protein
MKQVGVYDAKTHLPRLLDEVERGETVTITRHGRPVANLVPVSARQLTVEEAIETIREFGRKHPLRGLKIKDLIEEGRRY